MSRLPRVVRSASRLWGGKTVLSQRHAPRPQLEFGGICGSFFGTAPVAGFLVVGALFGKFPVIGPLFGKFGFGGSLGLGFGFGGGLGGGVFLRVDDLNRHGGFEAASDSNREHDHAEGAQWLVDLDLVAFQFEAELLLDGVGNLLIRNLPVDAVLGADGGGV